MILSTDCLLLGTFQFDHTPHFPLQITICMAGHGDLEGIVNAGVMSVSKTVSLPSKDHYEGTAVVSRGVFIYSMMMLLPGLSGCWSTGGRFRSESYCG